MNGTRCASVHYGTPTIPFVLAVPVRCSKQTGHTDEFHAASGQDLDGEVFGVAWREQPAVTA